jgi:hypothetical protein
VTRPARAGLAAAGLVLLGRPLALSPKATGPAGASPWARRNYRDRAVSLAGGPVAVAAAVGGAPALPALVAAGAALAVGRYDDVVGARPEQHRDKGFAGHLAALRAGRVSAGAIKIGGIGAAALVAASLRASGSDRRPVRLFADAALLAGTANLVNLLDLRPGRALKVVALGAGAALAVRPGAPAAALLGASLAALPDDVRECTMLGDAGANGLGVLLGVALLDVAGPRGRDVLLAAVLALTAASEQVSFSAVIDRTPPLAWLDRLGRD